MQAFLIGNKHAESKVPQTVVITCINCRNCRCKCLVSMAAPDARQAHYAFDQSYRL